MRSESPSVPPKMAASSSPAFFAALVLALAVLGSGAVLFFFDPAKSGFYPICLFHSLTGWNCPGCGGTRAAYQLLHGHLLRALRDNALFVLTLAALAIGSLRWAVRKMRNQPVTFNVPVKVWWGVLVGAFLFTVLRNLPAFAWLSP
ncbi:MAG: DUF2752 domain-containing protein [Verrucomicrobiia bacterium]